MTHIINTADTFVSDALEGLVAANPSLLRLVDGGVTRASALPEGHVAVIVGGGSGHYPAFAGVVGEGLAAAAVCGNVFTSPSAGQAYRVAREAEQGGGVLFLYGNYAGDVIHFGQAQERLRSEGFDTRTVLVTDDIASAPSAELRQRRGIAGDFPVFKIASAAADRGAAIDDVERIARKANYRTRTLGVAFGGCTLPGADEPLFTVPEGVMSVGLGIHGEPGISDEPTTTAAHLAERLLDQLLQDRPADITSLEGEEVILILNSLGGVTSEELFILYREVDNVLTQRGLRIFEPESGHLVTSLDMAGVSITLVWPDGELRELWSAPAYTPAYKKGSLKQAAPARRPQPSPLTERETNHPDTSRTVLLEEAPSVVALLASARDILVSHEQELGTLDAIAGDGDHGVGMVRGATAAEAAARAAVEAGAGAAFALAAGGHAWSEKAGGTSGALWGAALEAAANRLRESGNVTPETVAEAVRAAQDKVIKLGGARLGDKTMVDSMLPFTDTLSNALSQGLGVHDAWTRAAKAATEAAAETSQLRPLRGRARPLADKSIGHPDAGATSFALLVSELAARNS